MRSVRSTGTNLRRVRAACSSSQRVLGRPHFPLLVSSHAGSGRGESYSLALIGLDICLVIRASHNERTWSLNPYRMLPPGASPHRLRGLRPVPRSQSPIFQRWTTSMRGSLPHPCAAKPGDLEKVREHENRAPAYGSVRSTFSDLLILDLGATGYRKPQCHSSPRPLNVQSSFRASA